MHIQAPAGLLLCQPGAPGGGGSNLCENDGPVAESVPAGRQRPRSHRYSGARPVVAQFCRNVHIYIVAAVYESKISLTSLILEMSIMKQVWMLTKKASLHGILDVQMFLLIFVHIWLRGWIIKF